jgi:hypothetical protein
MYPLLTGALLFDDILLGDEFEKQIQTNEIAQEALTSTRTADRIRSPFGPAPFQKGFQVMRLHSNKVSKVETITFPSLLSSSRFP